MTVPPFEFTFEEYQDVRQALAQAEGALNMTARLARNSKVINPDGAAAVAASCGDALDLLQRAWRRREDNRESAVVDVTEVAGEFERRVEARLAKWAARYAEKGVQSASPLMDRVIAEQQVTDEMAAERAGSTPNEGGR